jgi:hypothetical protein
MSQQTPPNDRTPLSPYIEYLEGYSVRVQQALETLRTLEKFAGQFTTTQLQVMAQAVTSEGLSSTTGNLTNVTRFVHGNAFATAVGPVSVATTVGDDDLPFDPNTPTREPDDGERTIFQRVADLFVRHRNYAVSTSTLLNGLKLSRGALSTVLYTTHRDSFEKLKVKNQNRWRLKPEVYERLKAEAEAVTPSIADAKAKGEEKR